MYISNTVFSFTPVEHVKGCLCLFSAPPPMFKSSKINRLFCDTVTTRMIRDILIGCSCFYPSLATVLKNISESIFLKRCMVSGNKLQFRNVRYNISNILTPIVFIWHEFSLLFSVDPEWSRWGAGIYKVYPGSIYGITWTESSPLLGNWIT